MAIIAVSGVAGSALAISLSAPRIINPVEIKGINPQPEPPKTLTAPIESVNIQSINVTAPIEVQSRVQLDPQPEPPKELPTSIIDTGDAPNKNTKVQRTGLNPQPEPPLPAQIEELPVFQGVLLGSEETKTKIMKAETESSEKLNKILTLDPQLKVVGTKVLFSSSSTGSTTEFKMKTAMPAFFNGLVRALSKEGASTTIEKLDLKMVDGKLAYEVEATEPIKVFGLIPLKIDTKIIVDAEKEEVTGVKRPWYSFIATKANLSDLILLPNLNISKLTVTSSNGGVPVDGQPGRVVAEVTNDGATYLIVSPPILSGGHRMDFFGGDKWLGAYVPVMFLRPGESAKFDYYWDSVKCGSDAKVEAALDEGLEEATKEDNTATAKVVCGN